MIAREIISCVPGGYALHIFGTRQPFIVQHKSMCDFVEALPAYLQFAARNSRDRIADKASPAFTIAQALRRGKT